MWPHSQMLSTACGPSPFSSSPQSSVLPQSFSTQSVHLLLGPSFGILSACSLWDLQYLTMVTHCNIHFHPPTFMFNVFFICLGAQTEPREATVLCYYTNWSVKRSGAGYYPTSNINPYLCTHILYAFGGITKESVIRPSDKEQDIDNSEFTIMTNA